MGVLGKLNQEALSGIDTLAGLQQSYVSNPVANGDRKSSKNALEPARFALVVASISFFLLVLIAVQPSSFFSSDIFRTLAGSAYIGSSFGVGGLGETSFDWSLRLTGIGLFFFLSLGVVRLSGRESFADGTPTPQFAATEMPPFPRLPVRVRTVSSRPTRSSASGTAPNHEIERELRRRTSALEAQIAARIQQRIGKSVSASGNETRYELLKRDDHTVTGLIIKTPFGPGPV